MIPNQLNSQKSCQETVKTMDLEQFDCIVKAIVEGKYSWACVLILRFAGYNPAHYIPYRTYKRLIKESRRSQTVEQEASDSNGIARSPRSSLTPESKSSPWVEMTSKSRC
jgi:hypothetical protein